MVPSTCPGGCLCEKMSGFVFDKAVPCNSSRRCVGTMLSCEQIGVIYCAGTWCFTVKGTRKLFERSVPKPEVFWFCADTRCTKTDVCVQRVTGYKWGTTQQCCGGSVVKVIGDIPPDVEERVTSGPRAVFLEK